MGQCCGKQQKAEGNPDGDAGKVTPEIGLSYLTSVCSLTFSHIRYHG